MNSNNRFHFSLLLTYNAASIVPEGAERFTGNWRNGCLGTGPFRVNRFDKVQIELERNPFYWREGYPRADGVVFSLDVGPEETVAGFRSGRFSLTSWILPSDIEALRHEKEFSFRYVPRMSSNTLVFNIHRGPFADEELRRKVAQALDVEGIVTRHMARVAVPSVGLIPPGLLGYEPRRSSMPRPVKERLVERMPIRVMKSVAFQSSFRDAGNEIVSALENMGFQVTVTHYTEEGRKAVEDDISLQGWIADFPDTDTFAFGLLHTNEGFIGSWCGTPELDRLAERGRVETNPDVRHEIYREFEEIIKRHAVLIPLFYEVYSRFARPEVENFELSFSMLNPIPYEKLWIRR